MVAQTRRGFLSGGSARQTANLNDVEKDIQLEEAYARATVRLHVLVVVDVNYHWATRNHGVRYIWPFLKDASPYCTPMSCDRDSGAQPFCNERFAFGYARDNSTYPLFLLHPVREQGDTFSLISVRGGDAFLLNSTPEIRILSLEHFFDAFRAVPMRDLRSEVISAFHLSPVNRCK